MKNILFARLDGGISLMQPVPKDHIEKTHPEISDEDYEALVKSRIPADATNITETDEMPDMEFMEAWQIIDGQLAHDLEKARQVQLSRIRYARDVKFPELDKQYMLATEKNDAALIANVISQKQKLRDITEPLKALVLNNLDDVKKSFPQELKS